uniref:Uncharacterized protein n=1 Tax=Rhizophora mucronata TaxID=61149 RepID=A0A2P2QPA9_RHIMU
MCVTCECGCKNYDTLKRNQQMLIILTKLVK